MRYPTNLQVALDALSVVAICYLILLVAQKSL